jgi:hypothetical protein
MRWLEKHIDLFFKVNGILMLVTIIFGIFAILWTFGVPDNSPTTWTSYQWHMIDFLWKPAIINSLIGILFAILCVMRRYFVFALILLFNSHHFIDGCMWNIAQIIKYGFIYPVNNLQGLLMTLQFILAIIGIILWIRKILRGQSVYS